MNNKFYVLLPLIILSLGGCNNNTKTSKVNLSYGSRYDETATVLSSVALQERIDNEESFLLALMPGGDETKISCSCWKTFSIIIDKYVKNNDRIIYKTDVYKTEKYGILVPEHEDPGFAIFEKGVLKQQYIYKAKSPQTYFGNIDALTSFIDEISNEPNLIYVNDSQYLNLLNNKNDFAMSIIRKGCSDCKYLLPNVVEPFFTSKKVNQKLYLLDIEDLDHYHRGTEEEKRVYQEYKNSLLLADYEYDVDGNPILDKPINPVYGYSTGVVPTTFIYKSGEIVDGNVFFNDEVSKVDDKYYISKSYYSTERVNNLKYTSQVLLGVELKEEEVGNYNGYLYLPSSTGARLHTPILNEFLNYYFL